MTLQDLTDMVKAGLLEFQCPGVLHAIQGESLPKVVGEVMAHQAGGTVDYLLPE
jgi:hypothetical protein